MPMYTPYGDSVV